jgi:hypothetical protein
LNSKRIIANIPTVLMVVLCQYTFFCLPSLLKVDRKTIEERPERTKEIDKEIEAFGAKSIAAVFCFGKL